MNIANTSAPSRTGLQIMSDESESIASFTASQPVRILHPFGVDKYSTEDGWLLTYEHGKSPNGAPLVGVWILRNQRGEWVDFDMDLNYLAARNNLRFEQTVIHRIACGFDWETPRTPETDAAWIEAWKGNGKRGQVRATRMRDFAAGLELERDIARRWLEQAMDMLNRGVIEFENPDTNASVTWGDHAKSLLKELSRMFSWRGSQ